MSISKKDIKIILYIFGILVAVAAWFFVYKPQTEDNKTIEADVAKLQEEYNFLKGLEIRKAEIKKDKEEAEAAQQEILSHYPANFYEEDVLLHAAAIEENYGMEIDSVSLSGQAIAWAPASKNVPYILGTAAAGYSFDVTYNDMKAIVNSINTEDNHKSLDEVNLYYSPGTGELYGSLTMNHYFVMGSDKEYVSPEINIPVGTPNIFGTVSGAGN